MKNRTNPLAEVRAVCFDWGGTLMSEDGPEDIPMALWPTVQVLCGAEECLRQLAGCLPLAIATNASVSNRQMIEMALHRAGLGHYFHAVFCFTELGARKSDRAFWDRVSQGLSLSLDRIAMVGDSFEQDALLPSRYGVQAVWLDKSGAERHEHLGVPVVGDLTTFAGWVRERANRET